ncbi:MAG: chromate transporter, partial [Clostridiales bacterium]|nr:chromate transporter [Clostridiales bacterium]
VEDYGWLSEEEMLDFVALAQSSPGAIAVNAAILIGWRMAGFLGMVVCVIGTILPPMIILSIISFIYTQFISNLYVALLLKGMQAGVAAVILDVVFSMGKTVIAEKSLSSLLIMVFAFIATFIPGFNVIYIVMAAIIVGILRAYILYRKEQSL